MSNHVSFHRGQVECWLSTLESLYWDCPAWRQQIGSMIVDLLMSMDTPPAAAGGARDVVAHAWREFADLAVPAAEVLTRLDES